MLVASACGDHASTSAPVAPIASPAPSAPAAAVAPKPPVSVVRRALVRVAALEGSPLRDGVAVTVGQEIGHGATLTIARGERVALDVARSGRVSVDGPALVQLGSDSDGQLLVASGVVTVLVPPAGDGILISQRIATPLTTFMFRPGTTGVVAIDRSGAVLVNVIDGAGEVLSTEIVAPEKQAGAAPTQEVNRGAAQRLGSDGVTMLKPAEDLTDALTKARKFADAASKTPVDSLGTFGTGQRAVDECLIALVDEVAEGKRLELRHKQAVAAASTDDRGAIQRELAAHGQRLFRLRRVLMARWERVQVAWLALTPQTREGHSRTLSDLRGRVATSLPR